LSKKIAIYENYHAQFPGLGGLFHLIKIDANDTFTAKQEISAVDGGYLVWPMAAVSQALRDYNEGASVSAYFFHS
jgi:hypothetical protein